MGFLSRLFKKEPVLEPINYGLLGMDIHSHLVPGIDDGAKTIEDTISLLTKFEEMGYKKVITTPHVMSDYYRNTPESILGGLPAMREARDKAGLKIKIDAAAEYNVDADFEEKITSKQLLTFGDNYVLFELPFLQEPPNLTSCIFEMQTNGYKPILAHVERYAYWHNNWDKVEDILNKGIKLQLNLNSLSGFYGPEVKKMGEKLVDQDVITMVSSDCHHMGHMNIMKDISTKPYIHKIVNKEDLINKQLDPIIETEYSF